MNNLTLSIVILTHNNAAVLINCLQSIYQNRPAFNFEVIVVANACQDDTVSTVKANFPDVVVVETSENEGFSKGNNRGVKIAGGDFIMLLNDDTQIIDGALETFVQFMQNNPRVGIAGPLLLNADNTPQRQGGILGKKFWKADKPSPAPFVIGAALLIRRETLNQIGPMDENLYFYNDDLDWCLSARKAQWQVYLVPEAKIIHLGGHSIKKAFSRKHFAEGFKGGIYFCRKHYGRAAFWLYKLLLVILLPIAIVIYTALWLLFHGNNLEKAGAFWDVFIYALTYQL
ncbi:MAG: glycosyltransferase family 2 protein [Candidatus Margulisiibacteriota bacterium]